MVIKIVIAGLLLAGCPAGKDQRKTKPTPTPSASETDSNNQEGATSGADGQVTRGHEVTITGGGSDQRVTTDPNDYQENKQDSTEATTSQSPPQENPNQHSVEQTTDTSQSPTEKTVEQQPEKVENTKTTDSSTTDERQSSPTVSLSFVEQQGHLMPILELTDATAVTDIKIYRKAHDFAIDNDDFNNKVTEIPRQIYYVNLKVQGRQCNNEVEIDDMAQAKTFRMNCR